MAKASPVSISPQALVALRRDARKIKLLKGKIRARQSGQYQSRLRGRGMEFDEVRAYQPGDDVRSIDWRVTARTNTPHTKLYREEKERPVILCLDYRRSMRFATRGVFKSVMASQLAAVLAWAADFNGDRVGGLLFDDHQHKPLSAHRGKHAVLELFHRMSELHNGNSSDEPRPRALTDALSRLRHLSRPGSLVMIASDFYGLDEQASKHLSELARHCELVLLHIHDPIEAQLPSKGIYRFKDNQRDFQIDSRKLWQQHQQRFELRQDQLKTLARKHRMHYLSCSTALNPSEQLRQQLEVVNV